MSTRSGERRCARVRPATVTLGAICTRAAAKRSRRRRGHRGRLEPRPPARWRSEFCRRVARGPRVTGNGTRRHASLSSSYPPETPRPNRFLSVFFPGVCRPGRRRGGARDVVLRKAVGRAPPPSLPPQQAVRRGRVPWDVTHVGRVRGGGGREGRAGDERWSIRIVKETPCPAAAAIGTREKKKNKPTALLSIPPSRYTPAPCIHTSPVISFAIRTDYKTNNVGPSKHAGPGAPIPPPTPPGIIYTRAASAVRPYVQRVIRRYTSAGTTRLYGCCPAGLFDITHGPVRCRGGARSRAIRTDRPRGPAVAPCFNRTRQGYGERQSARRSRSLLTRRRRRGGV